MKQTVELAAHYYLDNFLRLCSTVDARYGDLLTGDERAVLECFHKLSFDSQCLYIRLISRTGPWFRESKLQYREIDSLDTCIDELLANNMAMLAEELDTEELNSLFTRAELQSAFAAQLPKDKYGSKAALIAAIDTLDLTSAALQKNLGSSEPGRILTPLHFEFIELLQLLFFGNRHQSLTEFVLEDIGITRYFPYSLNREERLFKNRAAVDEYQLCAAFADEHYDALALEDWDALPRLGRRLAKLNVQHGSSLRRYHSLCNRLARDLERMEEFGVALSLYRHSERHPARERQVRILEKRGDWKKAKRLCLQIIEAPWCEAEQEAARRILPRVERKLGGSATTRRRDQFKTCALSIPRGDRSVERLAAQSLSQDWHTVHYVENRLMNTLFGLAFWEEIFMPLPGVFHHPYQGGPADMFEQGFRERRAAAIEARVNVLLNGSLSVLLPQAYRRYQSNFCHWTDWRHIDEQLVRDSCQLIPNAHLVAIFERLLFDPRENRSGFPDLIALGKQPGDYRLIEVKGPGDALQDGQKRWLRYFDRQGIPAEVLWVNWTDD